MATYTSLFRRPFIAIISILLFLGQASSGPTPGSGTFDKRATGDKYLIGTGKGDITGPVVSIRDLMLDDS